MTVLEAIKRSSEFLEKKGVESPRLNAELLLAHALGMPRMKLYLAFEQVLTEGQTTTLRDLILRRGKREPLQHITGSTSFCGFEVKVTPAVLTPRPETEILAETAWKLVKCLQEKGTLNAAVLDIGTGSGCIPIALAHHCPEAFIVAVDISPEALEIARQNIQKHALAQRVHLVLSDLFSALDPSARFDLIVSNPPYIPAAEIQTLEPEVRDFDPRLALDGGPDGLEFYRKLAAQAPLFLNPHGRIVLEFGDGQADNLQNIFREQNWIVEAVHEDYTRRPRVLVGSRQRPSAGS